MQAAVWSPPTGTLGMLVAEAGRRAELLASRENELEAEARRAPAARPFASALVGERVAVIAEVKRRSPSRGVINPAIDAAGQARAYTRGGAAAISVLTEPSRFGGEVADLTDVIAAVAIPVLRKDFHVHPVQLFEARALGASAALLIVRALSPAGLKTLADLARAIGLETVVEVRDESELDRALAVGARVIGINNRDLETLRIDPTTTHRLVPLIPAGIVAIAESGMATVEDVEAAAHAGADAVLVGSSLSAATDPAAAVQALVGIRRAGRNG